MTIRLPCFGEHGHSCKVVTRAEWPDIDRWISGIQGLPGWTPPYDLMPRAHPARA